MEHIKIGTCATCSFFRTEVYPNQCRAMPPQVVVHDGYFKSVWPEVDYDDYCKLYDSAIVGGQHKKFPEKVQDGDKINENE